MWRMSTSVLIALVPLMSLASALAADEIVMRRDNFSADLAFIDSFLKRNWPREYRPEEALVGGWPELTLGRVEVGRYDVDDDGQVELFVRIEYGPECGSVGCPIAVFKKMGRDWTEVAGVSGFMGGTMNVWTDPDTGHKNVLSEYAGFRWTGEAYEYLDDNEVVEVSARIPPVLGEEGGCVAPDGQGFEYLMQYVGTANYLCLMYDPNIPAKARGPARARVPPLAQEP